MQVTETRRIEGRRGTGWAVTVEAGDGSWTRFDRVDGEDRWHLAADSIPGSWLPNREHGDLSRCTLPVHPKPEVAALLDAAVKPLDYGDVRCGICGQCVGCECASLPVLTPADRDEVYVGLGDFDGGEDFGGAFDGFTVTSDADPGL